MTVSPRRPMPARRLVRLSVSLLALAVGCGTPPPPPASPRPVVAAPSPRAPRPACPAVASPEGPPEARSLARVAERAFEALRAGRSVAGLGHLSMRQPGPSDLVSVRALRPCLTRVELREGRAHLEVRGADGPLGALELTVLPRHDGGWTLPEDLPLRVFDLDRLRRAREWPRDLSIETRLASRVSWVGAHADRLLCLHYPPETRCLSGPFADVASASTWFVDDGHACLQTSAGDQWILRWSDGPFHRGRCGSPPTLLGPAPELRPARPPFDAALLADLGVSRHPAGPVLLETETARRLCVEDGCVDVPAPEEVAVRTELAFGGVGRDEEGARWILLRRVRSEGGAEVSTGLETLLVYERGEGLRLRAALRLSRWHSERIDHLGGERSVWDSRVVTHPEVSIDATGCLTISAQQASRRVTDRFDADAARELSADPTEAAGDRLDGRDDHGLHGPWPLDLSGTWRVAPEGGLRRVARCDEGAGQPS